MKILTTLLRRNVQAFIVLICIACIPHTALAIEPIAAIGQPPPRQHAFLNNETIVRVVPSHIQIVDANTGDVVDEFGSLTYDSEVVISPNAAHLAILNDIFNTPKTNVEIWDTNTQEKIAEWESEIDISDDTAFSPVAPLLAGSSNNQVHLWNWKTGEYLGMMIGERRPLEQCYIHENGRICGGGSIRRAPVFSPDGKYLIVASRRPDIELWNVETRKLEGHFEGHTGNWVDGVAISPNGMYLASFERSTLVYVWDIESRQLLWKAKSAIGRIEEVTFSPDNQYLYVATKTTGLRKFGNLPWTGWDDKVRIWDVESGQQIDTISTTFHDLITITLSPNGKKALLHYLDGVVLWDIEKKRQQYVSADFVRDWFNDFTGLSPDGKTVVSVCPHFIKTWDVASQQMQVFVSAENHKFTGLAISPDSKTFVVGKEPWIELRDIQTGKVETQFPHFVGDAEEIAFSPSGRWLAAADHRGDIYILDVNNPERIQRIDREIELNSFRFSQIAFSENDKYLAASSRSGRSSPFKHWILLWKREGDTFIFQYASQVKKLYSPPAFTTSSDGSTVLAGPGANETQIWKVLLNGLQLLATLDGEGPVQFSQDGRYLLANFFDNQDNYHFQIWNWRTNRPIKHSSIQGFVSLSQDGSVLMSRDYDSTRQYLIWDIQNLLSLLPYPVEPKNKKFVTLGQIKQNQLLQNFPNPFNPETWIPFRLADKSNVTIRIYTPTGS